ncbi:MAG: DeoR/GlpR family DNA-binding transcription regulator [Spirochaetota bacterium]
MIEREREEVILRILRTDRCVTVTDICDLTGASEATVRRDLARLEDGGHMRRVRGGAEYMAAPADGAPAVAVPQRSLQERVGLQTEHKRRIARHAASHCRDGDTLLIDGGSTTYFLAEYLLDLRVTVVTNSFAIADALRNSPRARVFLPGGLLDPRSLLIQDPIGRDFYRDYAATLAIIGVEGVDERGITNTDMQVVQTQRNMISNARRVIVLADATKFATGGHLRSCGFDEIDLIITNAKPPAEIAAALREHNVGLETAPTR